MKNKKADIPVTILVIGVFAICLMALFSFLYVSAVKKNNFPGINLMESLNVDIEKFNFYNKETREMIDLFAKLLEPIMIIFLGIVVASLAISVLSPLYGALGSL